MTFSSSFIFPLSSLMHYTLTLLSCFANILSAFWYFITHVWVFSVIFLLIGWGGLYCLICPRVQLSAVSQMTEKKVRVSLYLSVFLHSFCFPVFFFLSLLHQLVSLSFPLCLILVFLFLREWFVSTSDPSVCVGLNALHHLSNDVMTQMTSKCATPRGHLCIYGSARTELWLRMIGGQKDRKLLMLCSF